MPNQKLVEWDSKYKFGIPTIDAQHAKIVTMINDLFVALQTSAQTAEKATLRIIEELLLHITSHFKYEEDLFAKFKWEKAEEHAKIHKKMSADIEELMKKYKTSPEMGKKLIFFLVDWLKVHIQQEDKQYAEFMKSKNIQ
jgi:hemerythrin-like metal-binding protein